jgi:hypothetical protein
MNIFRGPRHTWEIPDEYIARIILLAHCRVKWQAFVMTVMIIRVQ